MPLAEVFDQPACASSQASDALREAFNAEG
jgi:hypothetical protein